MNTLILQPPLMQLNTAYPSGAYLSGFFKSLGLKTEWLDLNIHLFYKIFCKKGIRILFEKCEKNALQLAEKAEKNGDEQTSFNLRRYVCQKEFWINWIEKIVQISTGKGIECAHEFIFGAHVPRGNRMDNFIQNLDHPLTSEDARSLASFALADLADFIQFSYDKNFSLIRYAESLTISEAVFSEIEKGASSTLINDFFIPLLEEIVSPKIKNSIQNNEKLLVCVSVPFPGVFACALALGKFIKENFGEKTYVSFGGGFINTELRETQEKALSKYCDALCYDRGFATYKTLLENFNEKKEIYNLTQFIKIPSANPDSTSTVKVILPRQATKEELEFERKITSEVLPDYTDIDFSIYPRLIDDTNPMHRLWSDGAWIKAFMAHGCYWHKCSFCDVNLDYVKSYCPTNIQNLYENLLNQCRQKGVFGIHFVDEAMPPAFMIQFAKENIRHGSPLTWWGNIRFEKYFTRDVADFLSYGGLIGVSAGLESATGNGLTEIHKGTDLESIVGACCAFKEAGILVHAYMIYGYWWEKSVDLINSMETLRQFYKAGLLDSCFWHKFVLTRHSRVYKEWQEGKHPELKVSPQKNIPLFAKNGLHFEGEKDSEKYGISLEYSLNEWMHGKNINKNVQFWFDFPVPKPTVPQNFIENLIQKYETKRDSSFAEKLPDDKSKIFWLGGTKIPVTRKNKKGKTEKFYQWNYMGEQFEEKESSPQTAFRGRGLCVLK